MGNRNANPTIISTKNTTENNTINNNINNVFYVELTTQHKVKIKEGNTISEHMNEIIFLDDSDIAINKLNKIQIDYDDFLSKIPETVKKLSFDNLSSLYQNSQLYDNIPNHITHVVTNIKGSKEGIFPQLSNLPTNLEKLSIVNLKSKHKIQNKIFKLSCDTNNILNASDEHIIIHNIKMPYGCIFECINVIYNSMDNIYFKLLFDCFEEDNYNKKYMKYKQKYLDLKK